jgi:hypothetical protein
MEEKEKIKECHFDGLERGTRRRWGGWFAFCCVCIDSRELAIAIGQLFLSLIPSLKGFQETVNTKVPVQMEAAF